MNRSIFIDFTYRVLAIYALLWGAELLLPKSSASAIVLVVIILLGIWVVKPGWNFRSRRVGGYCLFIFALLVASAMLAAWLLMFLKVRLPYDFATLSIAAALPGIIVITGAEELLFRQIMYRWLEQRHVSGWHIVVATALAFGCAHLGPLVFGSTIGVTFYLLQSIYMIWVGVLFGEIRNTTQSWSMSWLGHFSYNTVVLLFLSMAH